MQTALLIIALSIDVFLACITCGIEKIEIGRKTALCISMICSGVLFLSFAAGSLFGGMMKEDCMKYVGFVGFLLMGIWKLAEYVVRCYIRRHQYVCKQVKLSFSQLHFILSIYNNPVAADKDHSKQMSVQEGISFALAMSMDAVIAGLGADFLEVNIYLTTLCNFLMVLLVVWAGGWIGKRIARQLKRDFSWIGGALFLLLAFGKIL